MSDLSPSPIPPQLSQLSSEDCANQDSEYPIHGGPDATLQDPEPDASFNAEQVQASRHFEFQAVVEPEQRA
jgi:hypothetical protein